MENRNFYSIGEVSEMLGLKDYVIRFWEKEFEQLTPIISKKGNRRKYSLKDIHVIKRIQNLVHENGYTISGAKKRLTDEIKNDPYFFKESKLSSVLKKYENSEKEEKDKSIVQNEDVIIKFILKNLYDMLNLIQKEKKNFLKNGDKLL